MEKRPVRRRKAREYAMQMLYQQDLSGSRPAELRRVFWDANKTDVATRKFATGLFNNYLAHSEQIDDLIRRHSVNWRLERMAIVDRCILRMAIGEFIAEDAPPVVVIDEALEIARKFSGDDATEFINGILDAVRKELLSKEEIETKDE